MRRVFFVYTWMIWFVVSGSFSLSFAQTSAPMPKIVGGSLGVRVNAPKEDYASWVVYAQSPGAFDTLFFTSARPLNSAGAVRKDRTASVFYAVRDPSIRKDGKEPINEGWSPALPYQNTGSLIRSTHGASIMLAGNRSVLAGERNISLGNAVGTSYMLDLFELQSVSYSRYDEIFKGPVNAKRIHTLPIEAANTDSTWESQPTVSLEGGVNSPTYGKTLFFVSNRPEFPGDSTDDMNIWFIQRDIHGAWSAPKLVPGINTPGDEISPHCGADGRFYFSSNWDYKNSRIGSQGQEIYRCNYRDSAGILLPIMPVNLDEALTNDALVFYSSSTTNKGKSNSKPFGIEGLGRINSEADDCFPFITADGSYIFLTSNRKGSQDLDLYAFSLPKPRIRLRVYVREVEISADGVPLAPPRIVEGVSVTVLNKKKNSAYKLASSTDENFLEPDSPYILSLDTLLKEHCYTNALEGGEQISLTTTQPYNTDTLYIREFTIIKRRKPIPKIEFVPTSALAFFITGYWKPTTKENLSEFRSRHLAGFFKNTVFVDSTDLKSANYKNYDDIASAIDEQFEREFGKFADALSSVETLRFWEERVNCGNDTLFLKITVRGFTDKRGLRDGFYGDIPVTGKDASGKLITIPTGDRIMRQTASLPDSGQRGNIKLSILRARFMAEAFHRFMMRRDSARNVYRYLVENNRILPPEIIGMGVDKERFEQTREENDLYSRRIEMSFEFVRSSLKAQLANNAKPPAHEQTIPAPPAAKSNAEKTPDTLRIIDSVLSQPAHFDAQSQDRPIADNTNADTNSVYPFIPSVFIREDVLSDGAPQRQERKTLTTNVVAAEPPNDTEQIERCYTILYVSLEGDKQTAMRLRDILRSHNVADARVDLYISPIGKRFYRVCSGCFANDYEAFDYLKTLPSMRDILDVKTRPVVMRM